MASKLSKLIASIACINILFSGLTWMVFECQIWQERKGFRIPKDTANYFVGKEEAILIKGFKDGLDYSIDNSISGGIHNFIFNLMLWIAILFLWYKRVLPELRKKTAFEIDH